VARVSSTVASAVRTGGPKARQRGVSAAGSVPSKGGPGWSPRCRPGPAERRCARAAPPRRAQVAHVAVVHDGPLRKNRHDVPGMEGVQRFLQSAGHCLGAPYQDTSDAAHQPAEEQTVIHVLVDEKPHGSGGGHDEEQGVQHAAMVGSHHHRTLLGHKLRADYANGEPGVQKKPQKAAQTPVQWVSNSRPGPGLSYRSAVNVTCGMCDTVGLQGIRQCDVAMATAAAATSNHAASPFRLVALTCTSPFCRILTEAESESSRRLATLSGATRLLEGVAYSGSSGPYRTTHSMASHATA